MFKSDEKEIQAVTQVLKNRNYFRYQGPGVETITSACEKSWNNYLSSSYSLLLTSGTNALVVGMAAFGIGPGDEVIIPSYTFVATASAIMQVGAIPVIANVDETLTIDLEEVKKLINNRTKAVVAVHMDGMICNMDPLLNLCCEKGLLLFEDAAQACGGEYKGRKVGSLGAFGAFSFNVDKVISCGEGGLLSIAHESFKAQYLRAFIGHDTACQFGMTMKDELATESGFFGISSRLNEINSAILAEQLNKLPEILKELRERKTIFLKRLQEEGIPFRIGHDSEGDIGTHIHLIGKDPIHVMTMTKKLVEIGLRAMPPHLRPAHACWQWTAAMSKERYFVDELNPYRLTDKEYHYPKSNFLQTVQLMSHTCKIENEIHSSHEDFQIKVDKVIQIYKES